MNLYVKKFKMNIHIHSYNKHESGPYGHKRVGHGCGRRNTIFGDPHLKCKCYIIEKSTWFYLWFEK